MTECFAFCSIGAVGFGSRRRFSSLPPTRFCLKHGMMPPFFRYREPSFRRLRGDSIYNTGAAEKETQMKLYVGNLSYQTTEADLRQTFGQYGTVNSVDVIIDRDTGRSKGFAFIEMSDRNEANDAIQALNGTTLGDRTLAVNEAKPREERPGGGGGGGRSFGGGGGGGHRDHGGNRDRRY